MSANRSLAFDRNVLFGPVNVNLAFAGDTDIVDLLSENTKFFPTGFRVYAAYQKGTLSVVPQIVFDTGTDAQNVSAALTMTSVASGTNFHLAPPATVMQTITGAKKLRLKKTALAVGQATTFRARTDNVALLTTSAVHGLAVGDKVTVASVGGTGYNAELVTVLSVPTTSTFTYANEGADEASTADTAGRVGALLVQVWVTGINW